MVLPPEWAAPSFKGSSLGPSTIPMPTFTRDPEVMEVVLAAFSALGYALSARALLLLSLVGAFVLAVYAMHKGGVLPLVVLGVYAVFTVIPVTVLELRKTRT